jgi:sugar/nucleoside kinase (ribokinase family)
VSDGVDLMVLGDANPDLICTGDVVPAFGGTEQLLDRAVVTLGGSGAITAAGVARLGRSVAVAAVVGDDLFGQDVRRRLEERGVDVRGLVVDAGIATGLTVVLARGGDRASLTLPGAIAALSPERIDADHLRSARHVHVSQYFMQDALRPGLRAVLEGVRSQGGTTSVDPNGDPTGSWNGGLRDLLPLVDVVLPNAAEARAIAGVDDPGDAAGALAAHGTTAVVKDGARGALAASPSGILRAPGFAIDAVDATGAGDSFDAGFLAAFLEGRDLAECLRWGNACGALSTRAFGGTDAQPTRDEVERLLA